MHFSKDLETSLISQKDTDQFYVTDKESINSESLNSKCTFRRLFNDISFLKLLLIISVLDVLITVILFFTSSIITSITYEILACLALRLIGILVSVLMHNRGELFKVISKETVVVSFCILLIRFIMLGYTDQSSDQYSTNNILSYTFGIIFSLLEIAAMSNRYNDESYKPVVDKSMNEKENGELQEVRKVVAKTNTKYIGFNSLRLFCSLHVIMYHFYQTNSYHFENFMQWAVSALSFFFFLSGFLSTMRYAKYILADSETEENNDNIGSSSGKLKLSEFWFKRFFRLYPTYMFSIITMIAINGPNISSPELIILMIFCFQTWVGDYYSNKINTPGWSVGAFLFLYAIFPASCRIIGRFYEVKSLFQFYLVFWSLSILGMYIMCGYSTGQPFAPFLSFVVKAHMFEFLSGVSIGLLYRKVESEDKVYFGVSLINKYGVTVATIVLAILYVFVDVKINQYLFNCLNQGLMSPIFALMAWSIANGEDVIIQHLLSSKLLEFLGKFSYQIYILQSLSYSICKHLKIENFFLIINILFSIGVYYIIEVPSNSFLMFFLYNRVKKLTEFLNKIILKVFYDNPFQWVAIVKYYFLMFSVITVYILCIGYELEGNYQFYFDAGLGEALNVLRWLILACGPSILLALTGHIIWCPWWRAKVCSFDEMKANFKNKMYFRIVTRGIHPLLVRENVIKAVTVLEACLSKEMYLVEVVTDNRVDCFFYLFNHWHQELPELERKSLIDSTYQEIVVPSTYETLTGAKFKARALNYAITNSSATADDWIIHLDEETMFTAETVQYCLSHCYTQEIEMKKGDKQYPNIGQGVIIYGTGQHIEHYVTTLADSIRVADDFGKFRVQYEYHQPWIGMHGSFIVCPNSVEKLIGFDYGMAGSITEDAFFSLMAWSKGIKFSWVDAYMYEQSPFTIYDFIMQRRRWFGGLWIVCRNHQYIPFQYRACLLFMIITWAMSPLAILVTMSRIFLLSHDSDLFGKWIIAFFAAVICWGYVLGFVKTFSVKDGLARYLILLFLQLVLQPIFSIMEISGVLYAIVSPPSTSFHIVKKEGSAVSSAVSLKESNTSSTDLLVKNPLSANNLEMIPMKTFEDQIKVQI